MEQWGESNFITQARNGQTQSLCSAIQLSFFSIKQRIQTRRRLLNKNKIRFRSVGHSIIIQ